MPPRYWIVNCPVLYAPGVWTTWYRENCVALGWPPPTSRLEGPTDSQGWEYARSRAKQIKPGDYVIPYLMKWRLGPLARVVDVRIRDEEWAPTVPKGQYSLNPHEGEQGRRIQVAWQGDQNPPFGKAAVIPPENRKGGGETKHSLEELTEERFKLLQRILADPQNWVDFPADVQPEVIPPEVAAPAAATVTGLETEVRRFLARNLHLVEPGLRPHPDYPEVEEYVTDVGRLDLFCEDAAGRPVVIEVKAAEPTDQAVGQIARYLGWIKETYPDAPGVRGVLLAPSVQWVGVKAVQRAVPGLEIRRYRISCTVESP